MLNVLKSYTYIKNTMCVLVCFLCVNTSFAQFNKLIEARDLAKDQKYAQAIYILEQAISHPESKEDPQAWNLRAICYKNYFKQIGNFSTQKVSLLDTALSSALKSNKLTPEVDLKIENDKVINSVATNYFNIAKNYLLDSAIRDNSVSEKYYNKFKEITLIVKSNFNFKDLDLNYYNSIGACYADLFSKTFNNKYSDIAKSALSEVLIIDPKNISANLNMGIIYYNSGAKLIREMEYDIDISQLDVIQDNATKLLKQSLPFMSDVYELNPEDKTVLESLAGIYHQLNEEEKSLEFRRKKEALEKKIKDKK